MKRLNGKGQRGQSLVEFSLLLPVFLLLIFGIFDIGRIVFVYAMTSHAHRTALRSAPAVGYSGGSTVPYLDCTGMRNTATDVFGGANIVVTITYLNNDADPPSVIGTCTNTGDITDSQVDTGDMIEIESDLTITPITTSFIGIGTINFAFTGRRTIVKSFSFGAGVNDADYDGLDDTWEITWFGSTSAVIATDDSDGGGCTNGYEEEKGMIPNADYDDASYPCGKLYVAP